MEITTEQVRDLSVKVVEGFINDKVSLNDGITKCASELELNSEQIKRVVEASNTIAYLKLQKEAQDKTFEFPVANYEQVLGKLCTPETTDGTVAEADFTEGQVKQAEVAETQSLDAQTNQVLAAKFYFAHRHLLEKFAYDKAELTMNIGDLTKRLSKDPLVLEKLACVCTEDEYVSLSKFFEKKAELQTIILRDRDLIEVKDLLGMIKQATELIAEEKKLEELQKRAFVAAIGKAIGSGVGAAVSAAGNTIKGLYSGMKKSKVHPVDLAGAALTEPSPSSNVWDNLQATSKRY